MSSPIGQLTFRKEISDITNGNPCTVTTAEDHEFPTHSFVRLTDLNSSIPTPRGMDPLNNYRFRIVVTGDTTFTLQDPITYADIDSTNYPPYVSGGSANLIATEFIFYPPEGVTFPN